MSITPPEALSRHVLERKLRGARRLNLALGVLAVVAIGFGLFQSVSPSAQNHEEGANQQAAGSTPPVSQIERRIDGDPMAIGAIDAPIVLNEWIDMRCPFCAVYTRDTLPLIVQEYVDNGQVRIEMHDVAYFGEQSERAAVAARAAGEQGLYFEFVTAVHESAPEKGHPELPADELLMFAEHIGVRDLPKFEADLQSEDLLREVRESTARAQQLGVSGVPFFAVGERAFSGAQPIEAFRQFLDQQLQET